ncbi:MAG: thiosulfate oxidation carrier protein SoxY [Sphingobium sp.]
MTGRGGAVTRREAFRLGAGGMVVALMPLPAFATDDETAGAIREMFGNVLPQQGRVELTLPTLAETGNSVPITVAVDSPMSEADHVRRVAIFANRNPRPLIASVAFSAKAGKAAFTTNMRLNGTQDVIVLAEMNDGSLWQTQKRVMVTVGACDALQTRF